MESPRVEQRVDTVRKYVQEKKTWRPQPRTVAYLTTMLVAVIASAIIFPRLLPGTIRENEALLGNGRAISVVALGGESPRQFVPGPPKGEQYTAWGTSENREEVVVGWIGPGSGKGDKVSVQSRSAYSGRLQAEWPVTSKGDDPEIRQIGFLPTHNQIWFLASGVLQMVDIKSGAVLDFPFKGQNGRGQLTVPQHVTFASFSPKTGKLAYVEDGDLTLVTGLGTGRDGLPLASRVILDAGVTPAPGNGRPEGPVEGFAWIGDNNLAVIIGPAPATTIQFMAVSGGNAQMTSQSLHTTASESYLSISKAPQGTDFALFQGPARQQDAAGTTPYSLSALDQTGHPVKHLKLTGSLWRAPLSWDSP